ncbi:hypothetical protein JCM5296_004368 [Sporobolomyces johnsonii]
MADSVSQAQWAQKYQEAQATGTRATKLELAGSYDAAFQDYIQAAQTYLFLIRHTSDADTKAKLRTVSGKMVERAERIKQARKSQVGPVKRDRLSFEEQDQVLEKGSLVHGSRVPRWRNEDSTEQIGIPQSAQQPALSLAQLAQGCTWIPSSQAFQNASIAGASICGREIVQDNVSDCSLVAALIVGAEHHAKFGSKLGFSCLYPQDASGFPVRSRSGQYTARFRINGTSAILTLRLAEIDDRLPVSASGRPVCATTAHNDQIWPALVEKAYLKLMGGYDFAGSNSANDLHALSGWLPEHISLRQNFRSEQLWARIHKGCTLGKCVLTLGTGKATDELLAKSGLVPSHNYAVVDLRERHGRREVELVNPWRTTAPAQPSGSWTADLREALPPQEHSRTLIVDWENLPLHFASIHLNWDPTIFDYDESVHLTIPPTAAPPSPSPTTAARVHRHTTHIRLRLDPQPALRSEVWLLLSRHFASHQANDEYIGLTVSRAVDSSSASIGKLGLNDSSTMSDDPYYFYRFQPTSGASLYDVVISHQGPAADFCFTVQALSNVKLAIEDGPSPLPYSASLQGAWSGLTAGGNHTCSTFLYNPQYRITLSSPPGRPNATGELEAFAETSKDSPINVKLLYNGGKRVADFEDRDVLAGAATYSYGRDSCHASEVKTGSYTLIVSSFQPIHEASFDLVVRSSLPVQAAPIPSEGAGMFSRSVSGSWSEGLDGGSNDPLRNPTFKLDLTKPTGVKIRLQTPEGPLPIAISVYSANPDGSAHTQVFSTAPYSDLVCGVVTPMLRLELATAGYLVIPSTFSSGLHTSFQLFVYADAPVELGEITATSGDKCPVDDEKTALPIAAPLSLYHSTSALRPSNSTSMSWGYGKCTDSGNPNIHAHLIGGNVVDHEDVAPSAILCVAFFLAIVVVVGFRFHQWKATVVFGFLFGFFVTGLAFAIRAGIANRDSRSAILVEQSFFCLGQLALLATSLISIKIFISRATLVHWPSSLTYLGATLLVLAFVLDCIAFSRAPTPAQSYYTTLQYSQMRIAAAALAFIVATANVLGLPLAKVIAPELSLMELGLLTLSGWFLWVPAFYAFCVATITTDSSPLVCSSAFFYLSFGLFQLLAIIPLLTLALARYGWGLAFYDLVGYNVGGGGGAEAGGAIQEAILDIEAQKEEEELAAAHHEAEQARAWEEDEAMLLEEAQEVVGENAEAAGLHAHDGDDGWELHLQ